MSRVTLPDSPSVPNPVQAGRRERVLQAGGLAVVLLYLLVVIVQSSGKLLWIDELITLSIAQQPGIGGIWHALALGADPNPPLLHLLVQWSIALFGTSALAVRLPAILASLLAVLALWLILRRWISPAFAAAGALAYMATRGFDYSFDARSYALLSGFAMAALWLWMIASERAGLTRSLALCGLAVALAAGVSSNYYGVLAFLPITAAEVARTLERRRLQPGVWCALAAGVLPLLAYHSLIRGNIAEFGPHAWNRPHLTMIAESYFVLVEGIVWLALALGVWAACRPAPAVSDHENKAMPIPVRVAIGTILLYPVLGFVVAVGGAGMISPRCVVPVCCGFGLAVGVLGQKALGRFRRGGTGLVLLLVVWVVARETACRFLLDDQRQAFLALRDRVASTTGPVLLADSSLALPLYFYSSNEVRQRLIVPIDFEQIHRYEADDSGEQNLWAGRSGIFPLRIVTLDDVRLGTEPAVVIARPEGWLVHSLAARGVICSFSPPYAPFFRMGGALTPMAHFEDTVLTCSLNTIP